MSGRKNAIRVSLAAALFMAATSLCPAAAPPKSRLPFGSPNTIVTVRIKGLNKVLAAVGGMAGLFDPQVGMMVPQMGMMMLMQFPGIDPDGPAALLVLDPKRFGDNPMVGVVTLKNPAAFEKGVRNAQVRIVGNLGVIGTKDAVLAEVAKALTAQGLKTLPTRDMSEMIAVNVDVGGLVGRYKMDIQGALKMARVQLAAETETAGPDAKPLLGMGAKILDYLDKLVPEIERQAGVLELGITPDKNRTVLSVTLEARAGTPLARYFRRTGSPVNRDLARYLPKNAFASGLVSFDAAAQGDLSVGVVKILCDIAGVGPAETRRICTVIANFHRNLTGLNGMALVPGKDTPAGINLHEIKNRTAARANLKALCALANTGALGDLCKKFGVTVKFTEKHRVYRNIPVDKAEISVDLEKLLAALPIPPDAKQQMLPVLKTVAKDMKGVVSEFVYAKRLLVQADARSGPELMNRQIDLIRNGNGLGTMAEYKAAVGGHPQNACTLAHFSLFGYGDALSKIKVQDTPLPMPFPTRAELPANEKFLSASVRVEGNRAVLKVHVPMETVRDFAKAMQAKMKKMTEDAGAKPLPEL